MTTPEPTSTPTEAPKKRNCFLWGCVIVIILVLITSCCLGTLVLLPVFTDFDPLGIEGMIPWEEYLEDTSFMPDISEELDPYFEELPELEEEISPSLEPAEPEVSAMDISLTLYTAEDFSASFLYPEGWEIEVEDYGVTFYAPDYSVYLYVGEDLVDPGTTAEDVALDVVESLQADAQEGSFILYESAPYPLANGDDAYLAGFELVDSDDYYQWIYDLETVSGESNIFFFLSGDDPDDALMYRDILTEIGDSFRR
jgi:hypothetical protein